MRHRALCSWSGGKDSCFALMLAEKQGLNPTILLNVLNEEGKISRSHGIPAAILDLQAARAGLPIKMISSSWDDYEKKFTDALIELKKDHSVSHAIFGDIDLQAHRDWEEMVCRHAGLKAVLPLWQQDRKALVYQMLEEGIEAMIVSCNAIMGKNFIGKIISPELIIELEVLGIDPCGENGEYHTLVINCPLFYKRLEVQVEDIVEHEGYWFAKLK